MVIPARASQLGNTRRPARLHASSMYLIRDVYLVLIPVNTLRHLA
jgi:hypothetical protein